MTEGSGGNQPTAGAGSAVAVGLRTRCWVAGTPTHGNLTVTPGDVLGGSNPLVCGNEDYIVPEGAQATVRSLRELPVRFPTATLAGLQ